MSRILDPNFTKYKFRDLKVYCSTEWLADNKKKYRQVFDRYEATYIYAELSFYNKLFDDEDWNVQINIKCYSLKKGRKELCDLNFDRKVSKYDNIVYIREGWGNKKFGAFWKKGTYYWEAYVDGQKVATKYFYIEESTEKYPEPNAYVNIKSLKLYEGPYDDVPKEDRIYYKVFSKEETRYVYTEISLENLLPSKSWYCEIFVKFYNGSRQLKGQMMKLHHVDKDDESIELSMHWGSNIKGSWTEDNYTAEIVFMDKLLAVIPFEVDTEFEEGVAGAVLPNQYQPVVLNEEAVENANFEDVMAKLDELIGLQDIKRQVRDHASYLQFLQLRREKGFEEEEEINIHSVFIGNPGTGKTTVAQMMGKLYKSMGLLSKGHVHEVDRVDLVGEYIGQTAPKVKEAIEKARGGVLFIDEAYSLARSNDDSKDFGREVIEILVKEMSNGEGDMAVIVAGYPKEMEHFLTSNPGLKSRFKLYFTFSDYLPHELSAISQYACVKKNVVLEKQAKKMIDEIIIEAYRNRDRAFGNARFVYDLIDQAKIALGLRIMDDNDPKQFGKEELETVLVDDVQKIEIKRPKRLPNLPIDEKLLEMAMDELNHMIGISNIKKEINEMVSLVRFYRESSRDVLNKFYLHTVFVGNPGTGKTTVARILTKIYKALGVLERGHMVETDRQGLVAGYVGQTAIKTAERIDEAMGGVLFIDEAYALTSTGSGSLAGGSDFGNEAIQTILKRMEDSRGEFFVFAAGYPDNMETFLKANPGLRSRFDKILKFEDYESSSLYQIALQMLEEEGLEVNEDAKEHLTKYLDFLYEFRDKYFGNARTVRNIINDIVKNQSLRLASVPSEERNPNIINLITYEDVATLKLSHDDDIFNKKSIGFRKKSGAGE
ncbi:AAA family ATPase [Aureispira anguillae]|uniref:AAA family ATPase n=1 Tax=Aureispira anguillae TaxID=2864201 RepID=A0A915YLU1_9BACT|nr:AAA family ATPase [Aureispira anguillae]BDS15394.1 AAA family ATPase [Aureispira anguillae]